MLVDYLYNLDQIRKKHLNIFPLQTEPIKLDNMGITERNREIQRIGRICRRRSEMDEEKVERMAESKNGWR